MSEKTIHIRYFALLREERGVSDETVKTTAATAQDLFTELKGRFNFTLPRLLLKVAINDSFTNWDTQINENDTVVFIPPVAGG